MKPLLRWVVLPLLGLAVVAGSLVLLVNGLAEPAEGRPPPDPAMLITLPDGGQRTLGDLLAAAERAAAADDAVAGPAAPTPAGPEAEPPAAEEDDGDDKFALIVRSRDIGEPAPFIIESWRTDPDPDDPYELAEYHLWRTGQVEQAEALFRSVPADHPHYNVAQRRIGWEILTKERGQPRRGVAYINRSLAADPFDHDIWQDTWRVYMRTLGMEVR